MPQNLGLSNSMIPYAYLPARQRTNWCNIGYPAADWSQTHETIYIGILVELLWAERRDY